MNIEKNGNTYSVKESATMWELSAQLGNVTVSYNVKKSDCPTFDELKQFVAENNVF